MVNKIGQQMMLLGIVFMVAAFIAAILMIDPMKDLINIGRASLDCANTSITTGEKLSCLMVDAILPYFVITALVAGAAYIFYKTSMGG